MRLLLIDTCGDTGSLALAEDGVVLRQRTLPPRTASARLVSDLRAEMAALDWGVHSLSGVGVVNGPGSFTGVRVGLAAAKALCEVAGVPLATISRLELLLAAGMAADDDVAALDAGRSEFYVRFAGTSQELLMGREELLEHAPTRRVLIAEGGLLTAFGGRDVTVVSPALEGALPLVQRELRQGGIAVETADANYVRQARGLYASHGESCATEVHTAEGR